MRSAVETWRRDTVVETGEAEIAKRLGGIDGEEEEEEEEEKVSYS